MKRQPEDKNAPAPITQEEEAPMRRGPDPEPFHPLMGGGLSGKSVEDGNKREATEPEA